jgi:septal ring factor EnvC (AmiA/AmiB activator)
MSLKKSLSLFALLSVLFLQALPCKAQGYKKPLTAESTSLAEALKLLKSELTAQDADLQKLLKQLAQLQTEMNGLSDSLTESKKRLVSLTQQLDIERKEKQAWQLAAIATSAGLVVAVVMGLLK